MENILNQLHTPLFDNISEQDLPVMLSCIGYHIGTYKKGEILAYEEEQIRHIGLVLSGRVDLVKEDLWGNRTVLVHIRQDELFGETFVCGVENRSVVNFEVAEDAKILFLPFERVMHTCNQTCPFHHRLTENMVRMIAAKNLELLRKIEVISKRTVREKILAYLSIQAQQHHTKYFEIPMGRVELAEYLCVDRSALTRELSKMKDEGLIDFDKNCFRLL